MQKRISGFWTRSFVGAVVAVLAGMFMVTTSAQAAGVVGDGTPASCTDAEYAAAITGGGNVTFNCGPDPITIAVTTKVILAGEVTTVSGNDKVTLDGEDLRQLFIVANGAELTLRDITLTGGGGFDGSVVRVETNGVAFLRRANVTGNGTDVTNGGAIYNLGLMDIERSTLSENSAATFGGAVYSSGTLTVRNSYFLANETTNPLSDAGAIYNIGTLRIEGSTFNRNVALGNAGGIYNGGIAEITNSTIRENVAARGGGIFAIGNQNIDLVNVTVERNNADSGGNIWNQGTSAFTMLNTIVANASVTADNGTSSLDCDGPSVQSLGHNLISDGSCVTGADVTDQRNTEPMLESINDNGGFTPTVKPLPGSPAIDKGINAGCPAFDQRGNPRPIGIACDVGAVEVGVADAPNAAFLPFVNR